MMMIQRLGGVAMIASVLLLLVNAPIAVRAATEEQIEELELTLDVVEPPEEVMVGDPRVQIGTSAEDFVSGILDTDFHDVDGASMQVVTGPKGEKAEEAKKAGKGKGKSDEDAEGNEEEKLGSDSDEENLEVTDEADDEGQREAAAEEEEEAAEEEAEAAEEEEEAAEMEEEAAEEEEEAAEEEAEAAEEEEEAAEMEEEAAEEEEEAAEEEEEAAEKEEEAAEEEEAEEAAEEDTAPLEPVIEELAEEIQMEDNEEPLTGWEEFEQHESTHPTANEDNWEDVSSMPTADKEPAFPAGEPMGVRAEIPSDMIFLQFTGDFDLLTDEERLVEVIDVQFGQFLDWDLEEMYIKHETTMSFLQPDDEFRRELIALQDLEEGTNVAYASVSVLIGIEDSNPSPIFSFTKMNATDSLTEFFVPGNVAHLLGIYAKKYNLTVNTLELIEPDEIEFPSEEDELDQPVEGAQAPGDVQPEEPHQQPEPIDEDEGVDGQVVAGATEQDAPRTKRGKVLLAFLVIVCVAAGIGLIALVLFAVHIKRTENEHAGIDPMHLNLHEDATLLDDISRTSGKRASNLFTDFLDAPRMGDDDSTLHSHSTSDGSVGLRMVDGPDLVARAAGNWGPPKPESSRSSYSSRSFGRRSGDDGSASSGEMDEYGDVLRTINVT